MRKFSRVLSLIAATAILAAMLTACGSSSDDVKRIEKEATDTAVADTEEVAEESTEAAEEAAPVTTDGGYIYHAETSSGAIDVSIDMPMETVLASLGEADSYFEAKSCAFDGLDKMYTYGHFEIDTYPSEAGDMVSAVYLTDDLTGTPEGLYIGSSLEDMESIYGTDYEVNGNEYIYKAGDMSLKIQVIHSKVSYITYASKVLGTVAGN